MYLYFYSSLLQFLFFTTVIKYISYISPPRELNLYLENELSFSHFSHPISEKQDGLWFHVSLLKKLCFDIIINRYTSTHHISKYICTEKKKRNKLKHHGCTNIVYFCASCIITTPNYSIGVRFTIHIFRTQYRSCNECRQKPLWRVYQIEGT